MPNVVEPIMIEKNDSIKIIQIYSMYVWKKIIQTWGEEVKVEKSVENMAQLSVDLTHYRWSILWWL